MQGPYCCRTSFEKATRIRASKKNESATRRVAGIWKGCSLTYTLPLCWGTFGTQRPFRMGAINRDRSQNLAPQTHMLAPTASLLWQEFSKMANRLVLCAVLLVLDVLVTGLAARERTMAMVKPDGVRANHTEAIKAIIQRSGFDIMMEKTLQLDFMTAEAFYSEHSEKPFFEELILFMTSGPIVAMVLEQDNAVTNWRKLIGPTDPQKARSEEPNSIRALFGSSTTQNCVHGSDSQIAATREIMVFFKDVQADKGVMMGHDEL